MKSNLSTIALLAVLITLVGYQSFANRMASPTQPCLVATFDLERTFNSLDEKAALFAKIPELTSKLQADGLEQRKALEQMRADLEILVPNSAKRREAEEKLELALGNYRAYNEWIKLKVEAENGRALKQVYKNIRSAVRELAEANGYTVVLINDSVGEIPPGTVEDLTRQISNRRVMYSSADITDELIQHMNDVFKAANGGVATKTP